MTRIAALLTVTLVVLAAFLAWRLLVPGTEAGPPAAFPAIPRPEAWEGVAWSRVNSPVFEDQGFVHGVTAEGPEIVAWGEASVKDPATAQFTATAPLWRSSDGVTWLRSEIRSAGKPAWPQTLGVGPAGILGLLATEGGPRPLLAASADGITWSNVQAPPNLEVAQIIATAEGFVVVGSVNGRWVAWQPGSSVASDHLALPIVPGDVNPFEGRTTTDGAILVGRIVRNRTWDALIWRGTAEGWTLTGPGDPPFGGPEIGVQLERVVPFAGGFYLLGRQGVVPDCQLGVSTLVAGPIPAEFCGGPPPAAWVSTDGVTWRPARLPEPPGIAEPSVASLDAGAAGIVAIVSESRPIEERQRQGVWTSADGLEWTRLGDAPEGSSGTLVALPGRLVVVGSAEDGEHPAVWVGEPVPVGMTIRITVPASRPAQVALVLLVMIAFGALSVGLLLLVAGINLGQSLIPVAFTAWGIASLVGAYGVWRIRRWATWAVIGPQALAAVGLLAAYAGGARDWSVLLVAAMSAGAAGTAALSARQALSRPGQR